MKHILVLALIAGPALFAQGPSADWRTVATPHFRVHYPREYEEWATRAAQHLEDIRDAVSKEVGFTPPRTIDVLVTNPVAEPNGIAWPLLDTPRMIFFAEPPGPDEQLGAYGHWIDLLAVHETTHIVHMLRPSRNPLARLLPVNPITLRAPRWVLEGYATVIEGRLTGAGRPNSTLRALILRRWAQEGRLPAYGQLNTDRRFLGMSMAYLMGSAFLEWLEQRGGPDSLRHLWLRMTARQRRSFDAAFVGVFGESAERLYGRFVAELTGSSMAIDGELREGELFQETPRASGSPAVSPDGTKIAVVIRERNESQKLVVWSTGPAEEEEKEYAERMKRMLERDPLDVAPIRLKPLPRTALHSLVMPDGGDVDTPRWMRDGKAIVFAHRTPDAHGDLHFDLFRWDFATLTRITRLADVRDADPFPDGRHSVAVRSRFGSSQLVDVDLETGAVTPRAPASIDIVETHPRVSPDGKRIAHVAHRDGRWALFIDDVDVATPFDGDAATPEWTSNGDIVLTLFTRGFAELHSLANGPITRTRGGAFEPAPASDGRVFFMSLDPDGYVLRVLPSIALAPALPALDASLAPAIPPQHDNSKWTAGVLTESPSLLPTPTSALRLEPYWFAGGHSSPGDHALEAGMRLGDVLGRLDALFIASNDGGAIASVWRGWPIELGAHAFLLRDRGSNSCDPPSAICGLHRGLELRAHWDRHFARSRLIVEAGVNDFAFASALFSTTQLLGASRFNEAFRVEVDESHYRGMASLAYRAGSLRIAARVQHDSGGTVTLGGMASSILPRSSYSRTILDPALPLAILAGQGYDGWRIETSVPSMPFTAFYQRHDIEGETLSLVGARFELNTEPNPILKLPGLDLTLGTAHILEGPLRGDTKWWLGLRWHP
jgi:hypothetical protein